MSASAILEQAHKLGIRLALDATGEYLTIRPTPPPRLLAKIKKHEAEIVEFLQWEEAREEPEEISPREARRGREIADALNVFLALAEHIWYNETWCSALTKKVRHVRSN